MGILQDFVGVVLFFFFQAEDGIRDYKVTGVQMCALPIYIPACPPGAAFSARRCAPAWVASPDTATALAGMPGLCAGCRCAPPRWCSVRRTPGVRNARTPVPGFAWLPARSTCRALHPPPPEARSPFAQIAMQIDAADIPPLSPPRLSQTGPPGASPAPG